MTAPEQTGFPACVQHISHDITGIKLEPIVALSSSRAVGAEVLSVLSPHQQSESFSGLVSHPGAYVAGSTDRRVKTPSL